MKELNFEQMETLNGGDACSTSTGFMCGLTFCLLGTGPFACLAAGTGLYCAIGLYACR